MAASRPSLLGLLWPGYARPSLEDLQSALSRHDFAAVHHLMVDCKLDINSTTDCQAPGRPRSESWFEVAIASCSHWDHPRDLTNSKKAFDLILDATVDVKKNGPYALLNLLNANIWNKDPVTAQCQIYIINKLLDKKVNVNSILTHDGHTALHLAVNNNNKEICESLLSHGAKLSSEMCPERWVFKLYPRFHLHTPISLAIERGHFSLAEVLLDHAIEQAKEGVCSLFRVIGASVPFLAGNAQEAQLPLLKKLIDNKAQVSAIDNFGQNALSVLVQRRDYSAGISRKILSILLENKIDIYYDKNILAVVKNKYTYYSCGTEIIAMLEAAYKKENQKVFAHLLFKPLVNIINEYSADSEVEAKPKP